MSDPTESASPTPKRVQRQRARLKRPTQEELDDLPTKDRLELINQERLHQHQFWNSVGIVFGVMFTAGSLVATALTVRTGQEDLRTTREQLHTTQQGQVTDRYTKAIEQLGSGRPEVRLGGIYALQRLMVDSTRDRQTILEALAAYVRTHAQDPPPTGSDKTRLAVDVEAALTVADRHRKPRETFDLSNVDFRHKNLSGKDLAGANLRGADLESAGVESADLAGANLTGAALSDTDLDFADLAGAILRGANVQDADLLEADLHNADLRGAKLRSAYLSTADLTGANLNFAFLTNAHLHSADLRGADLTNTILRGADLRGADLRGVRGITPEEVRRVAKTNATTKF